MNALFVGDAHLGVPASPAYISLLRLLERCEQPMDYLIILGDLFDLWLGDNRKLIALHRPVLEVLRQLRGRGTRIYYLKGNHDIFMGQIFHKELDIQVCEDELVLELEGCRIFATHGDTINPRDYGYRLLRIILRSKLIEFLSRSLNDSMVYSIAQLVSSHTHADPHSQNEPAVRALFLSYARNLLDQDYHVVILGHSHIPQWEVHTRCTPQKIYLNPGSWFEHSTYIWYQNGHFYLRRLQEREEEILFDFKCQKGP